MAQTCSEGWHEGGAHLQPLLRNQRETPTWFDHGVLRHSGSSRQSSQRRLACCRHDHFTQSPRIKQATTSQYTRVERPTVHYPRGSGRSTMPSTGRKTRLQYMWTLRSAITRPWPSGTAAHTSSTNLGLRPLFLSSFWPTVFFNRSRIRMPLCLLHGAVTPHGHRDFSYRRFHRMGTGIFRSTQPR